jgi:hypothetical protein
MATAAGSS